MSDNQSGEQGTDPPSGGNGPPNGGGTGQSGGGGNGSPSDGGTGSSGAGGNGAPAGGGTGSSGARGNGASGSGNGPPGGRGGGSNGSPSGGLSIGRKLAAVVLAVLLTLTLVAGSGVAAAQMTVLSSDFVTESMAEEGGYRVMREAVTNTITDENGMVQVAGTQINATPIIDEALGRQYLRNQTESNVDRLYAYLHGEREDLTLYINTVPLKEDIAQAVEEEVRTSSLGTLIQRANVTLPAQIDAQQLSRMTESQQGYQEVRQQVRQQAREEAIDRAVEQAFNQASNDQLLALVIENYDPRDYTEQEKEQMVQERESEIRSALEQRIREERMDQINDRVQQELDAIRQETLNQTAENEVEAAVQDVEATVVRGLTSENMTYQQFSASLNDSKERLATAFGNRAREELDERIDDRQSLTDEMSASDRQALERLRGVVTTLDTLYYVIPVVGLVLIGLLYFATRSVQTVAAATGVAGLVAGLPLFFGTEVVGSMLESRIESQVQDQEAIAELLVGLIERVLGTVSAVGLTVAVAGLVLVVVWLLLRTGTLDEYVDVA